METKGHSEEFFGDYRDYWYNHDFLELMARRWKLSEVNSILDVGCGQGHWTKLISSFLRDGASVTAVDSDPKWGNQNEEMAMYFKERSMSFDIFQASGTKLPFDDNSFDAVTCQTVLIHVEDPVKVLLEMKRVLKPNGILICAEPNNLVASILKNSISSSDSIEEIVRDFTYSLVKEKGKIALGNGDISLGDVIPRLMNQIELKNIQSYISDKTILILPPYDTKEMKIMIDEIVSTEFSNFKDHETHEQFEVFGNKYNDVLLQVNQSEESNSVRLKKAIESNEFFDGGGSLMYLVSGRK
jgi:ubiquinone/menaquinone biosynthesis C-methylase UbiE